MKFVTINAYDSWYDSYEDGSVLDAAVQRYWQYLERMQEILPAHVLDLARLSGVDDGLIVRATHNRDQRLLMLTLRCGDLRIGYYDLRMRYEDAEISPQDEQKLARIAHTTKIIRHKHDLYFYEVDRIPDGRIEHRLLFHPGVWFAIRCRDLYWEKEDRPDRRLPAYKDRFPGGPAVSSSESEA